MKRLLRRMAANPTHHNPVAGYGNIVPHRLFRYGPETFLGEVQAVLRQEIENPGLDIEVITVEAESKSMRQYVVESRQKCIKCKDLSAVFTCSSERIPAYPDPTSANTFSPNTSSNCMKRVFEKYPCENILTLHPKVSYLIINAINWSRVLD